jgi:hypothetical protein
MGYGNYGSDIRDIMEGSITMCAACRIPSCPPGSELVSGSGACACSYCTKPRIRKSMKQAAGKVAITAPVKKPLPVKKIAIGLTVIALVAYLASTRLR